ncbi:hypothetical protein [Streptomyces sp. NPDC097619]|uniref:hypothetical protein n=1 Tax=Streptomyces sp. NPDC097619 TaxID=3157228 RepID=UPI0033211AA2
MNRIRTAAFAGTAVLLSVLAPAALSRADGPSSARHLQDPAGGNKAMKTAWTGGDKHKLSGQFRFHPGMDYKLKDKPGPAGAPEWGSKTPDLNTVAYRPRMVFSYEIATSTLLRKGISEKKGKHAVTLRAVLRDARGKRIAAVDEAKADRPAVLEKEFPVGRKIACDSGVYTVAWSISRTGPADTDRATVKGTLDWDSSCKEFKDSLSH